MFNNKNQKGQMEDLSSGTTNVAKGTVLEGNLETFGNIRIEGKIKGNIKCKSKIVLGESSEVEGNILAQNLEVAGEVKGKIEVSDVLILRSTSVILGDIFTNKMVMESGATFNGQCKMGATLKEITIGGTEGFREEKTA
ncbi:MAG: polymer-forming cytoskeletal protein [Cytophagaceae bacterium]